MLEHAAAHVELPGAALNRVIVADEARFGPAIHRLQAAAGQPLAYTATGPYRAIAKSIPGPLAPDGGTASTVVVRDFVAALALAFVNQFGEGEDWAHDAPRFFYVIAHELGHCKDTHIRGDTESVPLSWENGRVLRPAARFYGDVVLSEFAACVHSARAMPENVYVADVANWPADAALALEPIEPALTAYRADPDSPDRVQEFAVVAAQGLWVTCVQYAKLVGTSVGAPRAGRGAPRAVGPLPGMGFGER